MMRELARRGRRSSASMRRTPAATALSPTTADETDVAGAPHMGAAAKLDRPSHGVAAALAHGDDAHLVAVFLAEQRARAGLRSRRRPPSAAWSPARSAARRRWRCPRPARSPAPSSAWDGRNRSAAGRARPASPSAPRGRRAPGAAPRAGGGSPNDSRGWRCGAHDRPRARAASPTLSVPSSTTPEWTNTSPAFFCVSVTANRTPSRAHERRCRRPGRRDSP